MRQVLLDGPRVRLVCILVAASSTLVAGGCGKESPSSAAPQSPKGEPSPKIEWVDPASVQPGPVLRDSLTKEQEQRIRRVREVFVDVDSSPEEKWFNDFKRDVDPDREIAVWERMAQAYKRYCSTRTINQEAKKEVFGILLLRSSALEEEVLKHHKLRVLSPEEAREVMRDF